MTDPALLSSHARVPTDKASRYLQQLCRHFAHKLPAEATPEAGWVEFSIGTMRARAEDGVLALSVEASDEAALARLEDVAARHLERFMFREPPTIVWAREG